MSELSKIRNFAIIAHVDHGKSTLADRFLELTGVVKSGQHDEQLLDRNPISRERGITIKLAPVRMIYKNSKSEILNSKQYQNPNDKNSKHFEHLNFENSNLFRNSNLDIRILNSEHILNLIDTPGHVDFSYEVDRTLACVEGVILLVDATQGVQAQTISNAYKAIEKNLIIIPCVNKIDLPSAQVEKTKQQLVNFLGIKNEEIFAISAKTGKGVEELLMTVIEEIPAPTNPKSEARNLKQYQNPNDKNSKHFEHLNFENSNLFRNSNLDISALVFDSYYDSHRGVIAFVRLFNGELKQGIKVKLSAAAEVFEVKEVGYFSPELAKSERLESGEIGYVVTNLKDIHKVRVGDSIINIVNGQDHSLPGYKKVNPMVFASVFPTETNDYPNLKIAFEKLYLNDSSLQFLPIYSSSLGAGFRVGFLGLLHADVVLERLEREYNLSLILTPPQVEFKFERNLFYEPYVKILLITPQEYLGAVMKTCEEYRAKFITMDNKNQITLIYEMPMSEMISGFFDSLKSISSGYASFDWEFLRFEKVDADKLLLLLNGDPVEEFSEVVVSDRSLGKANQLVVKLRELIPRQQYEVRIQAKYKGRIIASERIAPFRKDVTKKLYGGDRTRKDKLLDKQKEGKKKMKMVGRVEIPKEAFMKLFRRN